MKRLPKIDWKTIDNQVITCMQTGNKILEGPGRIEYCLLDELSCPYQATSDKKLPYCRISRYGGPISP